MSCIIAFINSSEELNYSSYDKLVPLTALATEKLEEEGIDYISFENYVDYDTNLRELNALYKTLFQVFEKMDEIISDFYLDDRIKSFGPAKTYAWSLLYAFEYYIAFASIFKNIIKYYNATSIYFIEKKTEEADKSYPFCSSSNTLYGEILENVCKENRCQFQVTKANKSKPIINKFLPPKATFLAKVKSFTRDTELGKYVQKKRGLLIKEIIPRKNKLAQKALFVQEGWGIKYYQQFFKSLITPSDFQKKYEECFQKQSELKIIKFEDYVELFSEFRKKIDCQFGYKTDYIFKAVLNLFFEEIDTILKRANAFDASLKELSPDVIMYTNLPPDYLPLRMAGAWQKKSIVIKRHGEGLWHIPRWRAFDIVGTSLYLLEGNELKNYFQDEGKSNNETALICSDTIIYSQKRIPQKNGKKLLFVPYIFMGHGYPFGLDNYSDPMYYRMQVEILKVLDASNYSIIYKSMPKSSHSPFSPMENLIKKKYPDIELSYELLSTEIKKADYCLTDTPSTSLWDAAAAGIPVHSLVWDKFHVRKSAIELYKDYLTIFSTCDEINAKVKSILVEDKFKVMNLRKIGFEKLSKEKILEVFKKVHNDKSNQDK